MQNPSFIRLSGQLRQHRSGAGPAGARGIRGGGGLRVLSGDSGGPVRGTAKAVTLVTGHQGSRRWREGPGKRETGANSADSAEQWRGVLG